ncbi:PIWL2 protein, partial [Tichodroma muraria]|nr:PIWL2 protein [Tichodroma muraria]
MVLLVPELTFLTGLSDLRNNSRMLKEVMWEMIQSPQQHYKRLTRLLCRIRDTPDASRELERWGLCLDTDIYRTQGRVLPVERINLRHRSFLPAEDLGWHREVTKEVPIAVISINSWLLIYPKRLQHLAKDLLATMRSSCGAMGMQVGQPTVQELRDDRIETYVRTIQSSLGSQDKVQLLLCIIPSSRDDIYGAIKKLCCVQSPVPSQVINAQSLMGHPGKIRSVVQKVLLQINCKLGGQLWGVDIPLKQLMVVGMGVIPKSHFFSPPQKQLMVVGMDIHHSRSQGMRSVIGFVASMNQCVASWERGEGISCSALGIRRTSHPKIPSLGWEGREDAALPELLGSARSPPARLCREWLGKGLGMLSQSHFGVAQDLGGLCPVLGGGGSRCSFPFHPQRPHQDFFLLAHHSRQGCSVPTRYICMWNTANLSSEHLQRLTFKLCHLYWNWPGTVRVPAPCKYAHKLAFLVGQVLHHEPSAHFSEQLFFL